MAAKRREPRDGRTLELPVSGASAHASAVPAVILAASAVSQNSTKEAILPFLKVTMSAISVTVLLAGRGGADADAGVRHGSVPLDDEGDDLVALELEGADEARHRGPHAVAIGAAERYRARLPGAGEREHRVVGEVPDHALDVAAQAGRVGVLQNRLDRRPIRHGPPANAGDCGRRRCNRKRPATVEPQGAGAHFLE